MNSAIYINNNTTNNNSKYSSEKGLYSIQSLLTLVILLLIKTVSVVRRPTVVAFAQRLELP